MQRILREIADVIGLADTIEITRRWGGQTLNVPMRVEPGDPLALTLGTETARKLVAEFKGLRLQLPAEKNALLDLRNEAMARDHYVGRMSKSVLGPRYGLTRQGVNAVFRKMKATGHLQQFAGSEEVAALAESASPV
jgi:hypothetical protein